MLRAAVDVGGTFTDLAVADAGGRLWQYKALSTPSDPTAGVMEALGKAAAASGRTSAEFLAAIDVFVLGTTVATNIMVEGRGAKVGLVCTAGFRDSLAIRRGIRKDVWDMSAGHPAELVPRSLRLGVRERIDARGRVAIPLEESDVEMAAEAFRKAGVESVAICLMNSYLNDAHERRVQSLMQALLPGVFLSVSTEVLPLVGEYERTSTAVVNAFVGPKTRRYLSQLAGSLGSHGLKCRPLIMQSNGGVVGFDTLIRKPVNAVLSGPAAGASAAEYWCTLAAAQDVVFFDMGGTSTDVLITVGGKAMPATLMEIENYHIACPAIDIRTIGTGGGTIAQVDRGGMLRVGPGSAGSLPGPACYGRGGREPTVTDANLVLGRLNPSNFLGGEMSLDLDAARTSIDEHLARPLGLTPQRAALGVVGLANERMASAVKLVAAEGGTDLRRLVLVAAGGASGLHVSEVARSLGIRTVYIPREASVACAMGMLQSDVKQDAMQSLLRTFGAPVIEELNQRLGATADDAIDTLMRSGVERSHVVTAATVDLRYAGQQWQIGIPIPCPAGEADVAAALDAFHERHEALYGYRDPESAVQMVNVRVKAVVGMPKLGPVRVEREACETPPHAWREGWFGWSPDPVRMGIFEGARLRHGDVVTGPAVIEEAHTTVLVDRGDRLRVDAYGNFILESGGGGPA